MRDTSHAHLIILPSDHLAYFETLKVNLELFVGVSGRHEGRVVRKLLHHNPVVVLLRLEVEHVQSWDI